jgi:uncharacterized protein YhfF
VRTPLRRRLVDAVLAGEKMATASVLSDYVPHTENQLPVVGQHYVMLGFDDEPVGIVGTTELRVPAGGVDLQFARDEGEGFETIAAWRAAHERFWSDQQINRPDVDRLRTLRLGADPLTDPARGRARR